MAETTKSYILRSLIPILLGLLLTVVLLFVGAIAGGACHCVTPMTVFYPYSSIARGGFSWQTLSIILLGVQYPLYATVLAKAKGKYRVFAFIIVFSLHIAAVQVGLRVYHHG